MVETIQQMQITNPPPNIPSTLAIKRTTNWAWMPSLVKLAQLTKKMEQMMIELLVFKLQQDKHEVKQLELQNKLEFVVQKLEYLKHRIMIQEVQTKKLLQAKEQQLNKVHMDLFHMNQRKHNVEQQLLSMDRIKEKGDLLKQNQEKDDQW